MINKRNIYKFCCDDISLIENYDKAINDDTQTWDCHHRREIDDNKIAQQLIDENLYYNRPASELIFLTHSEHTRLHFKGKTSWKGRKHTEETKKKISETLKGKSSSEETRRKISEAIKLYWQNKN